MHRLLKKKTAMDAMNEALLQPSDYPGTDKTYNPGFFKGTEPEQIKHGAKSALRVSTIRRTAEVGEHTAPRILPPRPELRNHLDEDLKEELKVDKVAASDSIALTPEQDKFWVQAFKFYTQNGMRQERAARRADRDLKEKWPELAQYKHWLEPKTARSSGMSASSLLQKKTK